MTENNKASFNTIPHFIISDFHNGKIMRKELFLCLYIRAAATPYGVTTVSLDALKDDLFPELQKNTVNKILLALREKRYIFFEVRQGRRGSFEVHSGDWRLPKGGYKTLDKFFDGESASTKNNTKTSLPEVSQKSVGQNQKLLEIKRQLAERLSANPDSSQIRSHQNENENQTKIENNDSTLANKKRTRVRDFQPKSHEQQMCKEIAEAIGEEYINPLLSVLRKDGGFNAIEGAWGLYREDVQRRKSIDNRASYFFGIVKNILASAGRNQF